MSSTNGIKRYTPNARPIQNLLNAEISSRSRKPMKRLEPPMDSMVRPQKKEKSMKLAVKKLVLPPKPPLLPLISKKTNQQLVKKDHHVDLEQINAQPRLTAVVLPLHQTMHQV